MKIQKREPHVKNEIVIPISIGSGEKWEQVEIVVVDYNSGRGAGNIYEQQGKELGKLILNNTPGGFTTGLRAGLSSE